MNEAVCVQEIPTDMTADSEELCHEARDAVICGIKQLLTDLRVHNKVRILVIQSVVGSSTSCTSKKCGTRT